MNIKLTNVDLNSNGYKKGNLLSKLKNLKKYHEWIILNI